jgi:hypothetical protein
MVLVSIRRVAGGAVVQLAEDELGTGGGEHGGRRSGVVADQGAYVPAVGEQVTGGGAALVPGGAGDEDGLAVNVHGSLSALEGINLHLVSWS